MDDFIEMMNAIVIPLAAIWPTIAFHHFSLWRYSQTVGIAVSAGPFIAWLVFLLGYHGW